MPSTRAGRRRRSRPSPGGRLSSIARLVAQANLDGDRHVAFHVVDLGDSFDLGLLELPEDTHPFGELAGTLAPPEWDAFGLVVHGRVHHVEGEAGATRTTVAFVADRSDHEASVGVLDDELTDLPGRAVGTIPDLCRRVLGRPTPPPPPDTGLLWVTQWLDALRTGWQVPERRRSLTSSWPAIAALHPAAQGELLLHPDDLVERARAWTVAHPWSVVRTGPPVTLPDGPLPTSIASWMDDGFFARWVLGGIPPLPGLYDEVARFLDVGVRAEVADTLLALLPLADPPG